MKENIFSLVYADYDSEDYYFFNGPPGTTDEEFKKLCRRLTPKAGYRAVLKKSSPKESNDWIYWRDVVESLVSLLEEQGYQRVSLEGYRVRSTGSIIGSHNIKDDDHQLGFAGPLIAEYNFKLDKKLAEERKSKRKIYGTLRKKTVQIIK